MNMKKNKKGISPLIATVLLVGLVIVISILIWLWYGKYIEDVLEKQKIDLEIACVQDVEFILSDFTCSSEGLGFYAENTGSMDIRRFKVSYSGNGIGGAENTPGGVNQATRYLFSISINETIPESLEVDIIPIIGIGSKTKNCDSLIQHATITC